MEYHKKGNVVIVKSESQKGELTAKDVVNQIHALTQGLNKADSDKKNVEAQLENIENQISKMNDSLKELTKYKDWAETQQMSVIKSLVDENKNKCKDRVHGEYDYDEALTKEGNIAQMYGMYRQYLFVDKEINEKVASPLLYKYLHKKENLPNPFK